MLERCLGRAVVECRSHVHIQSSDQVCDVSSAELLKAITVDAIHDHHIEDILESNHRSALHAFTIRKDHPKALADITTFIAIS